MERLEAKRIIRDENLRRYSWFDDHSLRENEVGIKYEDGRWIVFVTDERGASVITGSVKKFENESDALDNFIKRLRAGKLLF